MNLPSCNDLATKAELQQLRDQIVQLLGQKDDGSTEDVLQGGGFGAATVVGGTILLARNSMQGIELAGSVSSDIGRELANGTVEWVKVKGSGARTLLSDLTKVAKKTAQKTIVTAAAVGGTATAAAAVTTGVAIVASTAVSVALNIASTKILGNRIDKTENALLKSQQDFANGVYKSLNKHQNNFNAAVAELEQAKLDIDNQQLVLDEVQIDIDTNFDNIQNLEDKNEVLETNLKKASRDIKQTQTELTNLATQYNQDITEANTAIETLNTTVKDAQDNIDLLAETIEVQKQDIELLKTKVADQETRIQVLSLAVTLNRAEIIQLQADIQSNKTLIQSSVTDLGSKIKILENQGVGSGSIPVTVQNSLSDQQKKTIELLDKLTGTNSNFSTDYNQIISGSTTFSTTADSLITTLPDLNNLPTTNQVTPQELTNFGTQLRSDISTDTNQIIQDKIGLLLLPSLNTVKQQTTPTAIKAAAETVVCDSTMPGGCLASNLLNPINNNLNGLAQGLGIGLNGANLGLNASIIGQITAMQAFLTKAWGSTTVQKALTTTNTILAFHNAIMLSRNLGQSVGDTMSIVLNALPIPAFDDNPIDVTSFVTTNLTKFVQTTVGTQNYQIITQGINSANRILTSAQGMVSAVGGVKNALQEGQEVIANRVGTLGNTMMDEGLFPDGSFDFMSTDVNFKGHFNKFTGFVSDLQGFIDETNQLVQSGIEVQENISQAYQNTQNVLTEKQQMFESFTQFNLTKQAEDATAETNSASPIITNADLVKDET